MFFMPHSSDADLYIISVLLLTAMVLIVTAGIKKNNKK